MRTRVKVFDDVVVVVVVVFVIVIVVVIFVIVEIRSRDVVKGAGRDVDPSYGNGSR